MIFAHDGSWWQRGTDWSAVVSAPERRTLAIVKATEGTGYVNETLAGPDGWDRSFMADAGLSLRGFYHFSHPGRNSPRAEAEHFLATLGELAPGEVPILDHEAEGVPAGWANEWLALVYERTGVLPWLYLSYAYAVDYPDELAQWPLWVAGYGANTGSIPNWGDGVEPDPQKFDVGPWGKSWALWQYTSNGAVPGVPGRCDDSVSYHSAADLLALAGVGAGPTDPPQEDDMFTQPDRDNLNNAARHAEDQRDIEWASAGDGSWGLGAWRIGQAAKAALGLPHRKEPDEAEHAQIMAFDAARIAHDTPGGGEPPDPVGRRTGEPGNREVG